MTEWVFAQRDPSEQLAQLHYFSVKKGSPAGEVEFVITVREYATPPEPNMRFFAQTDKQTNQKTAPFTPCGWGQSLIAALSECMQSIDRFPYEGSGS